MGGTQSRQPGTLPCHQQGQTGPPAGSLLQGLGQGRDQFGDLTQESKIFEGPPNLWENRASLLVHAQSPCAHPHPGASLSPCPRRACTSIACMHTHSHACMCRHSTNAHTVPLRACTHTPHLMPGHWWVPAQGGPSLVVPGIEPANLCTCSQSGSVSSNAAQPLLQLSGFGGGGGAALPTRAWSPHPCPLTPNPFPALSDRRTPTCLPTGWTKASLPEPAQDILCGHSSSLPPPSPPEMRGMWARSMRWAVDPSCRLLLSSQLPVGPGLVGEGAVASQAPVSQPPLVSWGKPKYVPRGCWVSQAPRWALQGPGGGTVLGEGTLSRCEWQGGSQPRVQPPEAEPGSAAEQPGGWAPEHAGAQEPGAGWAQELLPASPVRSFSTTHFAVSRKGVSVWVLTWVRTNVCSTAALGSCPLCPALPAPPIRPSFPVLPLSLAWIHTQGSLAGRDSGVDGLGGHLQPGPQPQPLVCWLLELWVCNGRSTSLAAHQICGAGLASGWQGKALFSLAWPSRAPFATDSAACCHLLGVSHSV